MQLRVPPRQHHGPAAGRQRFIGQRAPVQRFQSHRPQQFGRFRVAEVKGGVVGHSHRQGCWGTAPRAATGVSGLTVETPVDRIQLCTRLAGGCQQGPEPLQIEMGMGQVGPDPHPFSQISQLPGGQQAQMAGRAGPGSDGGGEPPAGAPRWRPGLRSAGPDAVRCPPD